MWLRLYDQLARNGISLSVLITSLQISAVGETLLKRHVLKRRQLRKLLKRLYKGAPYVNRLLVEMVAQKKVKYRKRFVEVLQSAQPHIWYFSQLHSLGPSRKLYYNCLFSFLYIFLVIAIVATLISHGKFRWSDKVCKCLCLHIWECLQAAWAAAEIPYYAAIRGQRHKVYFTHYFSGWN